MELDRDIRSVLDYMRSNVPAAKLVKVAETLPSLAHLMWGGYPKESFEVFTACYPQQSVATESSPVEVCAGDGSVAEGDGKKLR